MDDFNNGIARRAVLMTAGAGVGASLVSGLAHAQSATPAVAGEAEIWSQEYWAKKGDIPLWMFRKRIGAPKASEPARPVLFFVHGSSVTSRVFDLHVPARADIP